MFLSKNGKAVKPDGTIQKGFFYANVWKKSNNCLTLQRETLIFRKDGTKDWR